MLQRRRILLQRKLSQLMTHLNASPFPAHPPNPRLPLTRAAAYANVSATNNICLVKGIIYLKYIGFLFFFVVFFVHRVSHASCVETEAAEVQCDSRTPLKRCFSLPNVLALARQGGSLFHVSGVPDQRECDKAVCVYTPREREVGAWRLPERGRDACVTLIFKALKGFERLWKALKVREMEKKNI